MQPNTCTNEAFSSTSTTFNPYFGRYKTYKWQLLPKQGLNLVLYYFKYTFCSTRTLLKYFQFQLLYLYLYLSTIHTSSYLSTFMYTFNCTCTLLMYFLISARVLVLALHKISKYSLLSVRTWSPACPLHITNTQMDMSCYVHTLHIQGHSLYITCRCT